MEAPPSPLSSRAKPRDLQFYGSFLEMFFDRAARCRGSFGEAALVVEILSVIEIGTFDVGGGAVGYGPDIGR